MESAQHIAHRELLPRHVIETAFPLAAMADFGKSRSAEFRTRREREVFLKEGIKPDSLPGFFLIFVGIRF